MLEKSLGEGREKGVSSGAVIRVFRHESEWMGEHLFHVRVKFGFHLLPAALRMHP